MVEHTVVIGWGAGRYSFRWGWQAALFRWVARRWSGWTAWSVLDEEEKATSLKPKAPSPRQLRRINRRLLRQIDARRKAAAAASGPKEDDRG